MQKELQAHITSEDQLRGQVGALKHELQSSMGKINELSSHLEELRSRDYASQKEIETYQVRISDFDSALSTLKAELVSINHQHDLTLADFKSATHRAEDAEAIQRNLQEEAAGLMRSLDEMRPKIVELTGAKLDLTEKVDNLSDLLSQRDNTLLEMESRAEAAKSFAEASLRDYEQLERRTKTNNQASDAVLSDLQRAYDELKFQLDDALANAKEIDLDRGKQRQIAARLQQEVQTLSSSGSGREEDLFRLQAELDERMAAGNEQEALLSELQQEVEVLRSEVATKDGEIELLQREAPEADTTSSSLDNEVQSAMKHEHELALSNAQSRIRSLETSVFDAENQNRTLQKKIAELESELSQLRTNAISHTPPFPPRGASGRHSDEHGRRSFTSQRSNDFVHLPPSALIDRNLPAATRHQRHLSLAMLQARMYSEAESVVMSKMQQAADKQQVNATSIATTVDSAALHWPQFLDESHVFWCSTCKSPDLIVL